MYRLERIVLSNWGRLDPQDIEVDRSVAILGPTGAGKSTIIDALQVTMTGASSRFYDLNKSTGGTNTRTIRDYCLGADDHISADGPARAAADTLVGLCFRDAVSGRAVSIGVMFNATADEPKAKVRALFVARDYALSLARLTVTRPDGRSIVPLNTLLLARIKEECRECRLHQSATAFVDDYLIAMRPRGAAPDAHQVLRNFREAIAFQPIDDPTEFVRRHILEEDHIDVGALKASIERYKYLETEVRSRELQLTKIGGVRQRFEIWAGHIVRSNVLKFTAAHADATRLTVAAARVERQREELSLKLQHETDSKVQREQWIREIEDDIRRKSSLLAEAPEALQLRGLDAEKATLTKDRAASRQALDAHIEKLKRLAVLDRMRDGIPIRLHGGLDAVADFLEMLRGKDVESLVALAADLPAIERRMLTLLEAETSLRMQADALTNEIAGTKVKLDDLEQRIAAAKGGGMLSRQTNDFIALLAREGIEATPLPEIVEVSDPAWATALEMLLGANREALIVRRGRIADAYGLLFRERRTLNRCRLVDTRKTGSWRSHLPRGSIAEIIDTESEDARVFVERQVGRFVRAETEADLERHDQAITKRGKTTAGASLRVFADIEPILGKVAQQRATEAARNQLVELSRAQSTAMADRDAMNKAIVAISMLRDQSPTALTDAVSNLGESARALSANAAARDSAASPEAKALREEIVWLGEDVERRRREIREEIDPAIAALGKEDVALQVALHKHESDCQGRRAEEVQAEQKEAGHPIAALIVLLQLKETIDAARTRVAVTAELTPGDRDPTARLADLSAESRAEAEPLPRFAEDSARRGRNGFAAFVLDHLPAPPMTDPDDVDMLRWCKERERQLEEDELLQFRREFEEARMRMEADLTEGLINRLSDKFQKARQQIDRLNRSLAGRTFTGQTYKFQSYINEAMKPIHALALAIADEPRRGLQILQDQDVDPKVKNGFKELERRLSDDQLVKDLSDYRRFFDFDLSMTNDQGRETTLSKRAGTGSGGQKQAPYYVAVGAAMAAAYYPKSAHGEPEGVGLVVFDEAFNNLDAPNTKALLDFFAAIHLQVIVAAPDIKRGMFLEVVDTVVSINRRPDTLEPVATVTRPSAKAREALARANPVNLGVAAFRERSQAAE